MFTKNKMYFNVFVSVTFLFCIGGVFWLMGGLFGDKEEYVLKEIIFSENSMEMGFGEFEKVVMEDYIEEPDIKAMSRSMGSTAMGVLDFNQDGFFDLVVPDRDVKTGDIYINNEGREFVQMGPETDVDQFGFVLSVGESFSNQNNSPEIVLGTLEKVYIISYVKDEFLVSSVIEVPTVFAQTYGDVNADGYVDVFLSSWGSDEGGLYLGGESGYVDSKMTYVNENVDWNERPQRCQEANGHMNDESESFLKKTNLNFDSILVDYTGDGWLDLLVAGDFNTTGVFENREGVLVATEHVPLECNAMGADVGDINNDGLLDWFITSIYDPKAEENKKPWGGEGNMLYSLDEKNEWNKSEHASVIRNGAWGWGGCMEDFNNDGWIDIFQTNEYQEENFYDQHPRLFVNNQGKSLTEVYGRGVFSQETNAGAIACVDIDLDGDVDIVSNRGHEKPEIFMNQLFSKAREADNGGQNYLGISLDGPEGNVNGLGAKIVVETKRGEVMKHVMSKAGFTNKISLVHVGLGESKKAKVTVFWPQPGSKVSVFEEIDVNQNIEIDYYSELIK